MNIKRAIALSVLSFITTFVVGILANSFISIEGGDTLADIVLPDVFYYIQIVLAVIIAALFTYWYFRSPKVAPSFSHGLYFGLVGIAVGLIFDVLLFVPPVLSGEAIQTVLSFYLNPLFFSALILYVAVAGSVGFLLGKKQAQGNGTELEKEVN